MPSRRQVLAGAVAGLGGVGLAGNAVYQELRPKLSLTVLNFDNQPHSLTVQLVRRDADEWSEGREFLEYIDVPARPEDGDVPDIEFPDAVPAQPYIVRIEVDATGPHREFTYLPDCSGYGRDELRPQMFIALTSAGQVQLKGTGCSPNSLWY